MDRLLVNDRYFRGADGEIHDGEMYAAQCVAAAVAKERRGIIGYLDECYKVHNDEDLRRAIVALRSREPGPGKLEHMQPSDLVELKKACEKFNALVDAVNEFREKGGRS